jgi:PhzF family phenazine biosynthesis protein
VFFLVDAFTSNPFKGNPAGVCVVDAFPCDKLLQDVARYFNWSEIAFVVKLSNSVFQIRWFSPLDEAPLCGHATLAAAHVIFTQNLVSSHDVTFKYNGGEIIARTTCDGLISMSFPTKQVSRCDNAPFNVNDIIGVNRYVEIVNDELLYIIVLQDQRDVLRAVPNFEKIKKVDCRAIAITARCDDQYDFCSRYFAPRVGIFEDPVCGSMHCRLAWYWSAILHKNTFTAYQASKRSGVLYVKLNGDAVEISGTAVMVCKIDCIPLAHINLLESASSNRLACYHLPHTGDPVTR